MSATIQQEDVADTGKDDENNDITSPTFDNQGDSSITATGTNLDDNMNPDPTEQVSPISTAFDDTQQHSSSVEMSLNQMDATDPTNKSCVSDKPFQIGDAKIKIHANDTLMVEGEISCSSIADSSASDQIPNVFQPAVETGYKETTIDDCSDSDFELRWSDNDVEDNPNAEPLSDEALQALDKELGILNDEENSKKPSEESQKNTLNLVDDKVSGKNIQENIESKILFDESSNSDRKVDPSTDNTEKPITELGNTNDDIVKNDISLEEHVEKEAESMDISYESTDLINKEAIQSMDVVISPVQSESYCPTSIDSKNTLSNTQPSNTDKLSDINTDIDNKIDVTKVEKTSAIAMDETITDLKTVIDQDHDTGLNVDKSDKENNEKKATEQFLDTIPEDTKTDSVAKQSMQMDISPEIQSKTSIIDASLNDNFSKEKDEIIDTPLLKTIDNVQYSNSDQNMECSANLSETKSEQNNVEEVDTTVADQLNIKVSDNSKDKAEQHINLIVNTKRNTTKELNEIGTESKNKDDFSTPDITNESIKINTGHRINRPNVMLDIPTQEFEIDDFDDSMDTEEKLNKVPKDGNDLTSLTVTEIVNQLAKYDVDCMDIDKHSNLDKNKISAALKTTEDNASNISQKENPSVADISAEDIKKVLDKEKKGTPKSDVVEDISSTISKKDDQIDKTNLKATDNSENVPSLDKMETESVTEKEADVKLRKNYKNIETVPGKEDASTSKEDSVQNIEKVPQQQDQEAETLEKDDEIKEPHVLKISETSENISQPDNKTIEEEKITNEKSKEILQRNNTLSDVKLKENIENSGEVSRKKATKDSEAKQTSAEKENPDLLSKSMDGPKTSDNFKENIKNVEEVSQKGATKDSEAKPTIIEKESLDVLPSTSADVAKSDNPDEEVSDSLGLLAESVRVMDENEDDEPEQEDDADDNDGDRDDDDDDDFDPDDEESSNNTEEHSEESNSSRSEEDNKDDGIDIEFNNEADKIIMDSNDTTFDTLIGDSTDITVEDDDNETASTDTADVTKDAKNSSEQTGDGTKQTDSLLASLLTKPAADMNLPKQDGSESDILNKQKSGKSGVNNVSSSCEDDAKAKKQKPSVVQKAHHFSVANIKKTSAITSEAMEKLTKIGEIYDLVSDDDEKSEQKEVTYIERRREGNQCINYNCTSDDSVAYYLADRMTIAYYGAARKRRRPVCEPCLNVVNARNEGLVSGIKDLRPLMSLRMARPTHTLLEISDSDSEGEDEPVGEEGARLLEDKLADMLNEVWSKYNMDERLKETEDHLEAELEKMQKKSDEVDRLLHDCQKATDQLRVDFYSSFEGPRKELPALSIIDTPIASYACLETDEDVDPTPLVPVRYPKRRSTSVIDTPAKKTAIPSPYDDMRSTRSACDPGSKTDEDNDLSVVRLSAEAAPPDLPPSGEPSKPPLRVGALVYAMKNQYGAWLKAKVLDVQPKTKEQIFTMCRVRFEHKVKNPCKQLSARSIAYSEPCEVRMSIGMRVIALFKNTDNTNKKGEFYYSGIVAEIPNPVNLYRYLVFFDDGYAQYVEHKHTRLVYESKTLMWEEVHPFSRDFVCNYLMKYPERPMVRMHPGQEVTVEWNGKWWDTRVLAVDAALVQIQFPDERTEWIYRGSTRLQPLFAELQQAKRGDRSRQFRSTKASNKANVPYVEYTRSEDQDRQSEQSADWMSSTERSWDLRRQRSVAKKSTSIAHQISYAAIDGVISRVVFYTPKNSVRPYKMVPHTCGPQCKRSDLLTLNDLRTYNPLTKPLLSGWERQIVRHKSSRVVMYRAPCGRRLRNVIELHNYLRAIHSDMPVDLFDYNPNTHCLAEFVLNKSNVQKKDLSHGKENVPVPCVNYYDHSLPEFCSYNTERTPTSGVPLNLDPEFLCGCDCEDDCLDKSKCACWKMTFEGARTIGINNPDIGYYYRRLPDPLPSGIYECNSRCKCKSTCLNRVVQNPLQLKLQVFKTLNRGWGIRALNDVPKGSFICIYAGNLLTDATANLVLYLKDSLYLRNGRFVACDCVLPDPTSNLDGLNEGDEYLAELDYIEVVEAMKEGYEDDVPEADKILDKKEPKTPESVSESESTDSEEEETRDKTDIEDGDFQPGYVSYGITQFNKRLRRRDKKKIKEDEQKNEEDKLQTTDDKPTVKKEYTHTTNVDDAEECITISDDEEVRVSQREPSRLGAQELMTDNKVVPKYRSIRTHFGKDEACYIMDAKVQGNIGRYLNHSCSPNVFVQNVFVDTHDPRFPWVSFFALHHIRAGTELTWNYNYDVGSVPGKVLYCYCGAPNCRGRLL